MEEITRSGGRNPFGEGESAGENFIFIRLRLENRAGTSLLFTPLRATLAEGTEAPLSAVENADIVAFAGEESAAAEELARTSGSSATTSPPTCPRRAPSSAT